MKNKLILAVVGMCGSGKTEIVKYLKKKFSAPIIYFGDATFEQLKKEKLPVNEKNERYMREKIRKKFGMGAYAILNLPKIKKLARKNKIIIIESLYSWSEYKILKKTFGGRFKVAAAIASPVVRYKRLARRAERPMSNKKSLSRDYSEIENIEKGGPIIMADYPLLNDQDKKTLYKKIDKLKLSS